MKSIWDTFLYNHLEWQREWPFEPMIGGFSLEKLNIETEEEKENVTT